MNSVLELPGLSLSSRTQLFGAIRDSDTREDGVSPAVFGGRQGWLISGMDVARAVLGSSAVSKGRPIESQRVVGGVGAMRRTAARADKAKLIHALRLEALETQSVARHVTGALQARGVAEATGPGIGPHGGKLGRRSHVAEVVTFRTGGLTEAIAAGMLAQLSGQGVGSVNGTALRELVADAWERMEAPNSGGSDLQSDSADDLGRFIGRMLPGAASPFLNYLRSDGWTDGRIAEELRALLLASWGSTSALVLSALSLGLKGLPDMGTLNEVLRLYPPDFIIVRVMDREGIDRRFSIGDLLVISPWLIQRAASGWTNPNEFDPKRWDGPNRLRWFIPFGIGERRCPAAGLARTYARASVSHLQDLPWRRGEFVTLLESRSPALVAEPPYR